MTIRRVGLFLAAGLVVAVVLALFVSPFASDKPDGLEKVAAENGLQATQPATDSLADHVSTGVAGVIGVGVTFALAGGLFFVVRRRQQTAEPVAG